MKFRLDQGDKFSILKLWLNPTLSLSNSHSETREGVGLRRAEAAPHTNCWYVGLTNMEVHITTCARAKTRNSSKAGVVPACGDCTASWLLAGRLPPPISLSHNCFTSVCSHTGALFQIFFLDIRYIFFSSSRFVCVFLHQYTIFFCVNGSQKILSTIQKLTQI